ERRQPSRLARDPRDRRLVWRELGVATGTELEDLRLPEQRRERRLEVVRRRGDEVLLQPRGRLRGLDPRRLVDERAAFEDHRGLVREQLDEGEVVAREDGLVRGVGLEDTDAAIARG